MYSRETELRHLHSNDIYKLSVILDDNQCWKKLMEVIPKALTNSKLSEEPKYSNDHIRLIENAIQRPGESRLMSQILFDEWGTSGKKHERPTLGVLLQLLVRAELFRAADFVAMNFLNEPPPKRPFNGPAARVDISLTDEIFADIDDVVNDSSFYPETAALNDNAISFTDNNKDFYIKYHQHFEKFVETVPEHSPRTLRTSRQLLQKEHTYGDNSTAPIDNAAAGIERQELQPDNIITEKISCENIPKFSTLISKRFNIDTDLTYGQSNGSSNTTSDLQTHALTVSTYLSGTPFPTISIANQRIESDITNPISNCINTTISTADNDILPIISALNITGTHNAVIHPIIADQHFLTNRSGIISGGNSRSSSLSNGSLEDEEEAISNRYIDKGQVIDGQYADDDEIGLPNLSIFEQHSSNNDSSLTNVTDDNSLDDLNDCSSVSNENIPCLSALKQ